MQNTGKGNQYNSDGHARTHIHHAFFRWVFLLFLGLRVSSFYNDSSSAHFLKSASS